MHSEKLRLSKQRENIGLVKQGTVGTQGKAPWQIKQGSVRTYCKANQARLSENLKQIKQGSVRT